MKEILFVILVALLATGVLGLGIASDYLEGGTLYLAKGEEYEYGIRIQNVEEKQKTVTLNVSGIGKIVDYKDEYVLEPKTTNNAITIQIKMPKNATWKDEYSVGWKVLETSPDEGGMVSTAQGISGGIKVKLGEEKPKWWQQISTKMWINIIIATIAVLGAIGYGIRKKPEQNQ